MLEMGACACWRVVCVCNRSEHVNVGWRGWAQNEQGVASEQVQGVVCCSLGGSWSWRGRVAYSLGRPRSHD